MGADIDNFRRLLDTRQRRIEALAAVTFRHILQPPSQASAPVTPITTITSSTTNVTVQSNRTPQQSLLNSAPASRNPERALHVSPNIDEQTIATSSETVASSVRSNGRENLVSALPESTPAADEVSVPRRRAALRARAAIAEVYRRQKRTENGELN